MKSLELNLKERLLIVEQEAIEVNGENIDITESIKFGVEKLSKGKAEFLCLGPELTEEIAEDLVNIFDLSYFVDYNGHSPRCYVDTALESFISAIESKGWFWGENPFEKEVDLLVEDNSANGCAKYRKAFNEWQEAESRTFNPSKTLIFKIL